MDESIEDAFIDAGKMPKGSAAVIWYEDGSVTSILPRVDEDAEDSMLPDSPECWAAMAMALVTDFNDPLISRHRDGLVSRIHRFMVMMLDEVMEDDADPGWDEGGPPKSSPSVFRGLEIVRDEE